MADLRFNYDDFVAAISAYTEIAKSLKTTKENLITNMENLKSCWQSDAGTAFEDFYNDNWVAHVDLYVTVLEQLAHLLRKACAEYEVLEDKIPKICGE